MTQPKEDKAAKPTFNPDALYHYTWPGQDRKLVTGAELTALCRGADPNLLSIELVAEKPDVVDVALPFSVSEPDDSI